MNEECLPPTVLPSPSLLSRSDCDVRRSLAPSRRCCNSSAVISPELIYILITLLDKTLLLPQHSHVEITFSILNENLQRTDKTDETRKKTALTRDHNADIRGSR